MSLNIYIITALLLFGLGLTIVLTKRNLIFMLMGLELMLNGVNVNFVYFSQFDQNPDQAQIFSLFIMMVAAAEVAIALAIILKIRSYFKSIDPENISELK